MTVSFAFCWTIRTINARLAGSGLCTATIQFTTFQIEIVCTKEKSTFPFTPPNSRRLTSHSAPIALAHTPDLMDFTRICIYACEQFDTLQVHSNLHSAHTTNGTLEIERASQRAHECKRERDRAFESLSYNNNTTLRLFFFVFSFGICFSCKSKTIEYNDDDGLYKLLLRHHTHGTAHGDRAEHEQQQQRIDLADCWSFTKCFV